MNETLKIFPAAELKTKFDFYCDKLTADYDFGRIEAIQAIGKLKSKPDQARGHPDRHHHWRRGWQLRRR